MKQPKTVQGDDGLIHGVTFLANDIDSGDAIEQTWCRITYRGRPKTGEDPTCMSCVANRPQ